MRLDGAGAFSSSSLARSALISASTSRGLRSPKGPARSSARRWESAAMASSFSSLTALSSARPALSSSRAALRWRLRVSVTAASSRAQYRSMMRLSSMAGPPFSGANGPSDEADGFFRGILSGGPDFLHKRVQNDAVRVQCRAGSRGCQEGGQARGKGYFGQGMGRMWSFITLARYSLSTSFPDEITFCTILFTATDLSCFFPSYPL